MVLAVKDNYKKLKGEFESLKMLWQENLRHADFKQYEVLDKVVYARHVFHTQKL